MIRRLVLFLVMAMFAAPAIAAAGDTPLFASSDPIHVTLRGPLSLIARNRAELARPATITIAGTGETLPVTISPRGITRRATDVCQFPSIEVKFAAPPPQSVFAGQKTLKMVGYCRNSDAYQQYVLLEYAEYRMFNVLSPASFRVRLAQVDYVDDNGRPITTRYGFFIEDLGDVARRNGMHEAKLPDMIPVTALDPRHAALYALFQDMIANHDWSMRAGPKGTTCCHNARLIAPAKGVAAAVIPIPYDLDFSGLVNAPYATPPDELHMSSVRDRQYRGYCMHNAEAYAVAAEMRADRPQMLAALASTPGLTPSSIQRATAFLDQFFVQIATNDTMQAKVLRTCAG